MVKQCNKEKTFTCAAQVTSRKVSQSSSMRLNIILWFYVIAPLDPHTRLNFANKIVFSITTHSQLAPIKVSNHATPN